MNSKYGFGKQVDMPFDKAIEWVTQALQVEGFGVLTDIDVAATLKAKLGLERSPYLILGACNPRLAASALETDPSIGALLPCNVVLRASDGSGTIVEILDPAAALGIAKSPGIAPVATEAAERLRCVLDAVVSAASGDRPIDLSSAPTHPSLS